MTRTAEKVIWKDESYAIIGACFAGHKENGRGFLEPVSHECLEIKFELQRIPFLSKPPQTLQYRGRTFVQTFTADFICYKKIVVEIKAVSALIDAHRAQLLNYLNATGCELGLLLNFGSLSRYGRRTPRH
jgi:GxxExxY protein